MPSLEAFSPSSTPASREKRRGVVLVMSAFLIIVVFAMAAMAIDVGYMMLMKTQLQVAADAGALAAGNTLHKERAEVIQVGKDYACMHKAGGRKINSNEVLVELGIWDVDSGSFTPDSGVGNAVRVTARRDGESLFFGRVIGTNSFGTEASAISMANPKDIAFVIDLSGSMNDDTEPAWATSTVNSEFGPKGFPGIGNKLMQDVYDDFGYGSFPGKLEYLGTGVQRNRGWMTYAAMTGDYGPLSTPATAARDRIVPGDDEYTRQAKCYRWIIEYHLARVMPRATPEPTVANYDYWKAYIDYVLAGSYVDDGTIPPSSGGSGGGGSSPPSGPTPPIGWRPLWPSVERLAASPFGGAALLAASQSAWGLPLQAPTVSLTSAPDPMRTELPRVGGLYGGHRGWVPPEHGPDLIHKFNNPNTSSFPGADINLPKQLRNYFGYLTYVQFLMDHGRDLKPDGTQKVELSYESGICPLHSETVAGRTFKFPPRCQPMHATRRATIAAMDVMHERNRRIPSLGQRDQVSVVTFDKTDGSQVRYGLTASYVKAMGSVTKLQAVGDKSTTTATESGLKLAKELLKPKSEGGEAREKSTKIVVLMTDGMPNAYESSQGALNDFARDDKTGDAYGGGYYWLDAALMAAGELASDKVNVFPVGVGLGTDYDFMDRAARIGGTAGADNRARRGSGNPAEYEATLIDIFEEIVSLPTARLVE